MANNGEFKIEKGVPIPARKFGSGRTPKYPWRAMEVGDSFFVQSDNPKQTQQAITSTACNRRSHYGSRFTVRQVEGGVRVWRIE